MTTLLVGFDSAWTPSNRGALAGVLRTRDGTLRDLGPPQPVGFREAQDAILKWQADLTPTATLVLLDQPTIVKNPSGQRPVENIVGSPVSLRYGGMQPANTARSEMFGENAPVWSFLTRFGGPADPLRPEAMGTRVFETYPVLAMIALGWTLQDPRKTGRLPKYNPERRKTFSMADWKHVCGLASGALRKRGLQDLSEWIDRASRDHSPRKSDQDGLDACLCLLVSLYMAEGQECLMVGDLQTGYIVVPLCGALRAELETRCNLTRRVPSEWVRTFQWPGRFP